MLLFDCAQPVRKLWRPFEFRGQPLFQMVRGKLTSGQQPVKFRGREIQIPRDLLELRTIHSAQLVRAGETGGDGPYPANQAAGSR